MLKMFVGSTCMQQSATDGIRQTAIDLFPRIGRLTTWISEAGADTAKVNLLESDQARGLAHEVRLLARRAHLTLARPVWSGYGLPTEANRVFFSGPARVRESVAAVARAAGLETDRIVHAGADLADHRWRDLRTANVAVFDLSDADPQVFYELGSALALGSQLLLIAREGTTVPFDVAQDVRYYSPIGNLRGFIAEELDAALYGLHVQASRRSNADRTLAYLERMAAASSASLIGVALLSVRKAAADPVKFHDAVNMFNGYLGADEHDILFPRWPGSYPDPRAPRCFTIMPFRGAPQRAYGVVEAAAQRAGVQPVRGDISEGQQIIESIWDEICRATHITVDMTGFNLNVCLELGIAHTLGRSTRIIGVSGTERELLTRLPSVAKWRCHVYGEEGRSKRGLQTVLERFFATTETF
jgi:hypothetical protein